MKHPLGLIEGATENAAVVQALIDNLVARGLDPAVPRLFIIDGSKALSKAIRRSFGRDALIQRCQIHKARNIMERLPKPLHAAVRRVLRQAWELDDAEKAEKLIRNLARRLEHDCSGRVGEHSGGPRRNPHRHAAWPAEGTSSRARLHQHRGECHEHRASRLPQREAMAIGLDGAALDRGGYAGSSQRLPTIEGAQATSSTTCRSGSTSERKTQPTASLLAKPTPRNVNLGSDRFAMFNKERDIPPPCISITRQAAAGGLVFKARLRHKLIRPLTVTPPRNFSHPYG